MKKNDPELDYESPAPADIKAVRALMGPKFTQRDAAALIYCKRRTYQDWEAGQAHMHPGLFELFQIKVRMLCSAKPKKVDG